MSCILGAEVRNQKTADATAIPVIGLTLASAPAFAFYLPFLGPVGRSDGLGSGIVQGLVPAIILTVAVVLMVWLVQRELSEALRCISS